MSTKILRNPDVSTTIGDPASGHEPLEFHRRLPGYSPTPLIDAVGLAARLRVGRVWVKDESSRLGLPAFKVLGASWAVYRALEEHAGSEFEPWSTVDELKDRLRPLRPLTLAAATDGNHGRAVARMAKMLGLGARIFVPADMAVARIEAIESEAAEAVMVDGTYDDAVARSAEEAGERCLVISDTSWPGYEDVPRWVIEGYSTILWEIEDELARRDEDGPDLVVVQIGVGAFAAAVTGHFRRTGASSRPKIVGVEPTSASCMLSSVEAGRIVDVPGPHPSIMAGLNCGRPSLVAWPTVSKGVELFVAIEDDRAQQAMRALADEGLTSGETGAAGLGGLLELLTGGEHAGTRRTLGVDEATRVLLFNCEGATDPDAYARVVARAGDGAPHHG
jgi:diaminopropionate ammonia-lyase